MTTPQAFTPPLQARTPAITITADKLAGSGVSIAPRATRSELFNAVRVTYRDPSQGWAEVQAPLVTNATYEAAVKARAAEDPLVAAVLQAFPGAEVTRVYQPSDDQESQ
mgnify:CR=1 FL=1